MKVIVVPRKKRKEGTKKKRNGEESKTPHDVAVLRSVAKKKGPGDKATVYILSRQ